MKIFTILFSFKMYLLLLLGPYNYIFFHICLCLLISICLFQYRSFISATVTLRISFIVRLLLTLPSKKKSIRIWRRAKRRLQNVRSIPGRNISTMCLNPIWITLNVMPWSWGLNLKDRQNWCVQLLGQLSRCRNKMSNDLYSTDTIIYTYATWHFSMLWVLLYK